MLETMSSGKNGYRSVLLNIASPIKGNDRFLKLDLELCGDVIADAKPVSGFTCKGLEDAAEKMGLDQLTFIASKVDQSSGISGELAFCLAVENGLALKVPPRANQIRMLLAELSRIASHLQWLSNLALCVGFATAYHYAQRDRERALRLIEVVTGSRVSPVFCVPGGVVRDLPAGFWPEAREFVSSFERSLAEFRKMLTENDYFRGKLEGVGPLQPQKAISLGLSGPNLRASGVRMDARKTFPYLGYESIDFKVPVGRKGDCFDRFLVRMREMSESMSIVRALLDSMMEGDYYIEPLISEGGLVLEEYAVVECPHGRLGIFVKFNGGDGPAAFRAKGPSLASLYGLAEALKGQRISDAMLIATSFDLVLSEIDL